MPEFVYSIQLVIFDFDGTLADTIPGLASLAVPLLREHYQITSEHAQRIYYGTLGAPFRIQLEEAFPKHPNNAKVATTFEKQKACLLPTLSVFPDVKGIMTQLEISGLKVAICSSTTRELLHNYVKQHRLHCDWLGGLETGDDKAVQILRCLTDLNFAASQSCFIGDALRDASYAKAAGVSFIRLDRSQRTVCSLGEVLTWIT